MVILELNGKQLEELVLILNEAKENATDWSSFYENIPNMKQHKTEIIEVCNELLRQLKERAEEE